MEDDRQHFFCVSLSFIFFYFIRPLFMGAESCEKSESFLATFGPKLWSITLFVHARYGAMGR